MSIVQFVMDVERISRETQGRILQNVGVLIAQKKSRLARNTTKRKVTMRINGYRIKLRGQRQRPLAGNVAAVQRNK